MDTEDTFLGQRLVEQAGQHPGEAGFFPISDGIEALAARLLLAGHAERTIDAQYYLIKNDHTGNAFISVLLQAADRGVRVRLLVDDMFTGGYDAGMAALDSHPNFEIRIFNPFARRSARAVDGLTSFSRINRRMHNKSFTVDNQITIIGGRNIADEYFGAREDAKFGDLDVIGIGGVVQDVSEMFDSYWNHERAAPIAAFAKMPEDSAAQLQLLRERLEESRQSIMDTIYAEAVKDQVLEYVEVDTSGFIWAPYTLAVDSPDKTYKKKAGEVASITTPLRESLLSANSEAIIVSPYFVPRKKGVEALTAMQASGVDVIVITNSLAANNQASVHGGILGHLRERSYRCGAREDAKFGDLDVIGIGGVVQDVSEMFDSYWNHERAAPIAAFAKMPEDSAAQLQLLRERLEESRQSIMDTIYAEAVKDQVLEYVEVDTSGFIWAPYTLAVDSPDKTYKKKAGEVASITTPLRESLLSANSEAIIVSPYFVPRKKGVEALTAMQASGVDVIVITNSLAANNQASVHGGYAPSRKPLLKAGVRIFEVRPDAEIAGSELVAASGAKATLHTKAFFIDRREAFIGSFNFDPRSANINTELGVIIRSPELAEEFSERIMKALPKNTYEVFLNEKGKLRWRGFENGEEVIFDKEPQTTGWQRFVAGFMRILPIRGQL